MGQVPKNKCESPLLIIGNGRVARHFSFYLTHKQIPWIQWARSSLIQLENLIQTEKPSSVLVLIKDSEIVPWIESHPEVQKLPLIHFSGCLATPLATGMHPLMSFGPTLYDPEFYETIPFVCESGKLSFHEIFPQLKNPVFRIEEQDKALYHALCVMAGNFSVILWQKLFKDFETRLNLPASVAQPYLEQITRNLVSNPTLALTGPLQRKDQVTIEKNLASLEGDAFKTVYQAFKEIYS